MTEASAAAACLPKRPTEMGGSPLDPAYRVHRNRQPCVTRNNGPSPDIQTTPDEPVDEDDEAAHHDATCDEQGELPPIEAVRCKLPSP